MRTNRSRIGRGGRGGRRPARYAQRSQAVVGTVAVRLAAGRLAAAEPDLFGRLGGERDRGQPGVLVRAVAKRLAGAAPAGAPEISLAGLDSDAVGLFLCWDRFAHSVFPVVALASVRAIWRPVRSAATVFEPRPAHKPAWPGGAQERLMAVYT